MKATSALLALGVCLAMFTPSARAEVQKWRLGYNSYLNGHYGYVWNGAFKDQAVAALNNNDYAAFQALTAGFNGQDAAGNYTNGWSGRIDRAKNGQFVDPKEKFTFLYLDVNAPWEGKTSPGYHILELPTAGGHKVGDQNSETWGPEEFAKAGGESGVVGQALAALSIGTEPPGLSQAGFVPAVQTNGLSNGDEVRCAAPAEIVFGGAHYTNLYKVVVRTWDTNAAPPAWSAPVTNDAADGQYVYVHGATSGSITWLYKRDGWQLDLAVAPAGRGTVAFNPEPDLSGCCYADGAGDVTLTPAPVSGGFAFVKWVVDEEEKTDNPLIVNMATNHTVRAVFRSLALTWNSDGTGSWTDGGAGWLDENNAAANWANGATAVFKNGGGLNMSVGAGVTVTAVRVEGGALTLEGDAALTLIDDAVIAATNENASIAIHVPIAGAHGLNVFARFEEQSFIIGKPAAFTGTLAVGAGRIGFGPDGSLGTKAADRWKFAGPVVLAENAVLVTPPAIIQVWENELSGEGRVLVQNTAGDAWATAIFKKALWKGGLTVGTNGTVSVWNDALGLPGEGLVEAVDGGVIEIYNKGQCNRTGQIRIGPGSKLKFIKEAASQKSPVLLEGGVIALESKKNIEFGNLVVTNGGAIEITGTDADHQKPLAFKNNAALTVRGDGVCSNLAGYELQHANKNAAATLTLDVADGPGAAGLVISGEITGACTEKTIVKTGAGTAVFFGATNSYVCTTRIDEGTLRLETDRAMGAGAPVELNGGTLDLGTGDNTQPGFGVGSLVLTKSSTLKLSQGKIAFAASPATGWADGAELDIVGAFGPRIVRFGTDTNGLTTAQIDKIKLNGESKPLHLDTAGWLCGNPAGTAILLR